MPKVLQSDPKGLQNGALGGQLGDFFCKKPTLHPTAYLLCFRHILEVLASPVLRKFLLEMCVGSRSPKKAITLSLFLIFRRKCVKMVPKWEGAEVTKTALFLLGPPLGAPGFIVIAFCTPWAAFWHLFGPFLLSFAVPGHHFGTLGPHQNDSQRVQNSMKMNPHTTRAGFIFVEF